MNSPKLSSVLNSITTHFQIYIWAITISIFFTSCGGESVPEYLQDARVDVSTRTPIKEVFFKKNDLNLVKAIVPLKDSSEFLIVSDNQALTLLNNKIKPSTAILNHELSDFSILRNTLGEPGYIVGSGLWGKPSAAVLDMTGQLKWKIDYGYEAMGKTAVLDDGDKRFVVLEKKEELLFLDFESGKIVRKGSPNRIIASADFSGNGHYEILVGLAETEFAILDGKQNELSKLSVSDDYWYEPVVTSSMLPFVVISAGDVLDVYDSKLKHIKKFDAQGALSPMHVVAATFIGDGPNAPFAAVYEGRGGWHRSILYVFSSTGELVYKEILEGNYQSITSVPQSDGMAFLLGGRNEVLLYSFQQ
jgi:hypothetical protein